MFIFDPPYLSLFFTSTTLLSGGNLQDVQQQLTKELPHTYLVDLGVWTPVQLFNFRYVPVLYQPVLVNCVNTGWNAYLSFIQHRELQEIKEKKSEID
jgi:hypothetical protein